MAIELSDLIEIMTWIKEIPAENRERLLFVGDTKFYVDNNDLSQIARSLGMDIRDSKDPISNKNFGYICGFHRTDTLGLEGQCSIKYDLMSELPTELISQFDLIIDAGVLFWTFNPGTAIANLSRMAAVGGRILHITALSGHFGSGYYNIHPLFFTDFYKLNEFKLLTGGGCRNRRMSLLSLILSKMKINIRIRRTKSDYRDIENTSPGDLGLVLSTPISRVLIKFHLKRLALFDRSVGIFCFKKIEQIDKVSFPLLLELELAQTH